MANFLNAIAKKTHNSDSPFGVSPIQMRGFGVQKKSQESSPMTKTQLWENYQQAKQLNQKGANISPAAILPIQAKLIQAKLSIGQPGDKYEQEADSVANRVMAMSEPAQVQREGLPEEEQKLQMKPLAEKISPLVQREELPQEEALQMKQSSQPNAQTATPDLESQLSSSKGRGNPLSDDVRSFMEPRFGADFSGVRVHTGSDAVQMNQDVNAQVFAHGQDIYFGAGKAPGKDALTAHELTHVVQQTGAVQTELLQREDEDEDNKTVVNFDSELELPIELKDKKGQVVFTQAANLELSLSTKALYTANASKVRFSFGKLKLATVLSAVSEMDSGVPAANTEATVSGGASVTILSVKITSPSLFLPAGSTLKIGGDLKGTANIFDGSLEPKIEPKIGITIPLTKKAILELEASPGVEYGGKLNISF
jgi:Domain of unknown function (DUF4157)